MQLVIFVVCGLALAADLSELMALIMSSKSAQFEFCVDASQKSWLGKNGSIMLALSSW